MKGSCLVILVISLSFCFTACGDSNQSSISREIENSKNNVTTESDKNAVERTSNENMIENSPLGENVGSVGLAFQPLSGGTCHISGVGSCTDSNVSIPKYIDGYKVTGLCDKAFYNCKNLKSITIPEGVTSIGNYAFHKCTNLERISLPNSITSIGAQAFANCDSLTNVVIPDKVTRLEFNTFYGCFKLETLTIPASVTFIEGGVLSSNYLKNVYFNGTRSQWNAITNYDYYYQFRKFTVRCTDGQILPEDPLY